jgi:hypothetical protein
MPSDVDPQGAFTNPYARPVRDFLGQALQMRWQFPFIPQVIQLLAFLLMIAVCVILYCTVGLASQVSGAFWKLIVDAKGRMEGRTSLEKSAYVVAVGVYFACFLPFFLPQLPFWMIGWLWVRLSSGWMWLMLGVLLALAVVAVMTYEPYRGWLNDSLLSISGK